MIKSLLHTISFLFLLTSISMAVPLEQKIGQMLMVGFYGTTASSESPICKDIRRYNIGAVILFDYNPTDKSKPKNIFSKNQVTKLTKQLQKCTNDGKLLIAVDQEGGKVQRLKKKYDGFYGEFPKASSVVKMNQSQIYNTYKKMSKELKSSGINYNLAPVVDLDINKKNHVIHGLGRSFGKNPKMVASYARTFIGAMHSYGVLTSLKHFPGHGSSMGDTHKGFVDVTTLWKPKELEPYKLLIDVADTVMVAHVFNKNIDSTYPASLSYKSITGKLRKELGYKGVVITDDLQMGAISLKYSMQETLKLAINAGNDILLIGNQLGKTKKLKTKKLIELIVKMVKSGNIKSSTIENAYLRIRKLKQKL